VWKILAASWDQIVTLPAYSLEGSNTIMRSIMLRFAGCVIGAVGILAIADLFIQRWRFEQSIKQTRAEVKEDIKALEGNPAIKNKIRSIQRDNSRRRPVSGVKDADVIVTSPTHYAVALEYKPETMSAPRVVAKGQDLLSKKDKELGREHDIPTVDNLPLAQALYRFTEVDQEIPPDLYKAVAEVLAGVYRSRKRT
jgi:flagellar biosynthesis protein FlhB